MDVVDVKVAPWDEQSFCAKMLDDLHFLTRKVYEKPQAIVENFNEALIKWVQ